MAAHEPSVLEVSFMRAWKLISGDYPCPKRQHYFHPRRKWRFDFAWEAERVAVEVEGGIRTHPVRCNHCRQMVQRRYKKGSQKMVQVYAAMGGHLSMTNFQNDCDKYNAAAVLGWRVLRYTAKHLTDSPVQMVEQIQALLAEGRKVEVETQGELFEPVDVRGKTKELFR